MPAAFLAARRAAPIRDPRSAIAWPAEPDAGSTDFAGNRKVAMTSSMTIRTPEYYDIVQHPAQL